MVVQDLLQVSLSPSTRDTYQRAFRTYQTFHQLYNRDKIIFPISTISMARFIAFCKQSKGMKHNSITTMVAGLSYFHRLWGYRSPATTFLIRYLLKATKVNNFPDKRLPITIPILLQLLHSVSVQMPSKYDQLLVRTMFLVAYFGLLRIGEFTKTRLGSSNCLQRHQISFKLVSGKLTSARLHFMHYKHSNGSEQSVPLSRSENKQLCPVRNLYKYYSKSTDSTGPLFKHKCGFPVSDSYFRATLKSCLKYAGLDSSKYTPHSFGIVGATYAHDRQYTATQIKGLGCWRSDSYRKYIRPKEKGIR